MGKLAQIQIHNEKTIFFTILNENYFPRHSTNSSQKPD